MGVIACLYMINVLYKNKEKVIENTTKTFDKYFKNKIYFDELYKELGNLNLYFKYIVND